MSDISALPTEHSKLLLYELLQDNNVYNVECTVTEGCEQGDNYLGEIKRIVVKSKRDGGVVYNIIMKHSPNKDNFKAINMDDMYDRELTLYKFILPAFLRLQQEFNVPKSEIFDYAKCYKADNQVLLLEDLRVSGFKMHDRFESLDSHHLELALKSLGRYHAMSFAMKHHRPDKYADVENFMKVNNLEKGYSNAIHKLSTQALALIDESLKEKLQTFCDSIFEKFNKLTGHESAHPYNVFCHGDCWNNNMLFKYENDIPVAMRFLDWQLSRYASPITDIVYLLYCSTTANIRKEYGCKIFDIYYDALDKHLGYFKLDAAKCYPRSIFERHSREFRLYGLVMALVILPIIMADKGKELKIENIVEEADDHDEELNVGKASMDRLSDVVREFIEMKMI